MDTMTPELVPPTRFAERIRTARPEASFAVRVDTLMLNVGLRCDLACAHCHQSSSPERSEVMARETMLDALRMAEILHPSLIDVTGGEPSLWPLLPELVEAVRELGVNVRVRTNLVALTRPDCAHLPALFAKSGVSILGSLPGMNAREVAEQRGTAFDRSLTALRTLADLGYADGDPALTLDIAYNPPLGELSRSEAALAEEFRAALSPLGVRFDSLRVIANVPAGRYARRLRESGAYDAELTRLAGAFNADVLGGLACRHGIEVAWDGTLSDCDFNLGAGIRVTDGPRTLAEALALGNSLAATLSARRIAFGPHCYACTTGAGSG